MSCGRNPPADHRPDWLAVSLTGVQPMIRFMTVAVCLVLASPGLDAGSFGRQLGAQATDLVLLVMNERGVHALLDSKVTLGGNASAAAGPKGRDASASLRAEILSYSRTRGLFVGVSLEGASLRPDNDASEQVYGRRISAHTIVTSTGISVPAAGRRFVDALEKNAPRNESQKVTRNEQ